MKREAESVASALIVNNMSTSQLMAGLLLINSFLYSPVLLGVKQKYSRLYIK